MIIKRIDQASFSGRGFGNLLPYLEHGDSDTDKCLHYEYVNSVSQSDYEMTAILGGNVRNQEPYEHLMISWMEHEKPTIEQAKEAVEIVLKNIGCKNAQAKWALHQNTDNIHVHLVVVRKDLMNDMSIIKPAFIVNNLHKACAEIVHKQEWERIAGQVYDYADGVGAVEINDRSKTIGKPRINQKSQDYEAHTGAESAITKAQKMVSAILKNAKDWQSLHTELAENGLSIEARKGGLVLVGFDVPVKLSDINRAFSKSKLEKVLGNFEPIAAQGGRRVVVKSADISIDSVREDYAPDRRYAEYQQAKFEYNNGRQAQVKSFRARQEHERSELIKKAKLERVDLAKDYKYVKFNKPEISVTFNAFKSVLAARQAQEKAELQAKQKAAREQFFRELPYFPRWQDWLTGVDVEPLRQQECDFMYIIGDSGNLALPLDIRAFKYEVVGDAVYYRNQKYDPAFIDKGKRIDVNSWRDEATRRASIQLSVTKWNMFNINGSDEYKEAMIKTAVAMGVANKIANRELQEVIKLEQAKFNLEQEIKVMTKQQQEFDKYAKAVDADGYRVVAIKLDDSGSRAFFFGDKDSTGKPEAMSYDKVMRQIPRFAKWETDKHDNIYYVPVSADRHHILIDDMDKAKLGTLIKDGFKPAVLIESSPNNFQAIITLDKQSDDQRINSRVENRLIEQLNQKYGDAKLQGPLHPHRAPAFHNLKAKHKGEDGSHPEVVLRKHEQRHCDKTKDIALAMIADIKEELFKQEQAQSDLRNKAKMVIRGSIDQAYYFFDGEVKKRFGDDQSKVDVMVATRLGAMGFSQSEVAGCIAINSPAVRPVSEANKHDWKKYGERASRVAFSEDAHVMRDYSERYQEYWQKQLGWVESVRQPPKPKIGSKKDWDYGQSM